jgi:3-oxoacyl-[acyl-carrier-protein] synthase III
MTRCAIVGIAEGWQRAEAGDSVMRLQALAASAALEDAGLAPSDVDGVLCAGLHDGLMPAVALAEHLGIEPRFTDSTNLGGAAAEAHVDHAAMAIAAGRCEVALIASGSTHRRDLRDGTAPPGDAVRQRRDRAPLWASTHDRRVRNDRSPPHA